jgi:serine/threonine-protein kinase
MTEPLPAASAPEDQLDDPHDDLNQTGVAVGDVLAGKYRVDQVLGAGGMGVVVRATHQILNSKVAMKFLLPEYVNNTGIVERFLREARAAVSIKNPHVAGVIDVGTLDSGSPYIVMEYLQGRDLADVLEAEVYLRDVHRAARFVLQACEGLAAAHANGIVHRDIKPGNLFITSASDGTEQVKVLDFGISKSGTELNNLTRTGAVMGSPMYMSPEQMRSTRNVDQRSDVWSLGVVAFELLTGRLPYEAETMTELVAMVLEHDPPRTRDLRPDVPAALDDAVAGALTKNPDNRYPNVAAFAQDIATAVGDPNLHEQAQRIQRIVSRGNADMTGSQQISSATGLPMARSHIRTRPDEDKKRKGALIAAAVVALLLAGGLGAYFASNGGPAEAPALQAEGADAPMEVPLPTLPPEPVPSEAEAAAQAAEAEAAAAALAAAEAEAEAAARAEAEAAAQAEVAAAAAAADSSHRSSSRSSGSRSGSSSQPSMTATATPATTSPPATMSSAASLLLDRN